MNKWFYAKDGQAIGPLSTPEMHELIGQGACTRTTLVWTRGMRDWLPACMADWMWEQRPERGAVTDEAEDGSLAMHRLQHSGPEAVVLDMMLPGQSGFSVLERARAMTPPPPVVMVTANHGHRHAELARSLGAAAYLVKPVPLERLVAAVAAALDA